MWEFFPFANVSLPYTSGQDPEVSSWRTEKTGTIRPTNHHDKWYWNTNTNETQWCFFIWFLALQETGFFLYKIQFLPPISTIKYIQILSS